eukprot:2408604-Alexandrium_andersonii.AAC.1
MARSVRRSWSRGERGVARCWAVTRWAAHLCATSASLVRAACRCGARGEAWRADAQSWSARRSGGGSFSLAMPGGS